MTQATSTIHIRVRLEEATLRTMLDELLPITILLDEAAANPDLSAPDRPDGGREGRWVRVEKASEVDFLAGQGLRLVSAGQIRWVTAGVPVEATLHSAKILLRPEVVADKHGGRLVFRPSLEAADLKNVPALLDRGVVALVNRQLEVKGQELAWDFGRTLSFAVPLPPMLAGIQSLQMDARNATVSVSADAVELGLTVSLHFLRKPGA
jgi:hypothetical protein